MSLMWKKLFTLPKIAERIPHLEGTGQTADITLWSRGWWMDFKRARRIKKQNDFSTSARSVWVLTWTQPACQEISALVINACVSVGLLAWRDWRDLWLLLVCASPWGRNYESIWELAWMLAREEQLLNGKQSEKGFYVCLPN